MTMFEQADRLVGIYETHLCTISELVQGLLEIKDTHRPRDLQ